jgi:hypothetical protein
MSFIVIWLHFFLQAENRKNLTADNADLHGSKKENTYHGDAEARRKLNHQTDFAKLRMGSFYRVRDEWKAWLEKKQKVLPAYSRADEYARSLTAVRMTNF